MYESIETLNNQNYLKTLRIISYIILISMISLLLTFLTVKILNSLNRDSRFYKIKSFATFAVYSAVISTIVTISVILGTRLFGKGNLVNDLTILDGQVTIISGLKYWFIATVVSSLLLFVFKFAFMKYNQKYLVNQCEKSNKNSDINSRKVFLATLAGDVLKTLLWPVLISVITSIDFQKMSTKAGIVAIAIILVLVTLFNFIHCLSINVIFDKSEFFSKDINNKRRLQYIGSILIASFIGAVIFGGIRLAIPQIFHLMKLEYNIPLGFKNLDVLNNSQSFLTICVVDCLCLIFGFMMINWLSKKIFIKLTERDKVGAVEDKLYLDIDFDESKINNDNLEIEKKTPSQIRLANLIFPRSKAYDNEIHKVYPNDSRSKEFFDDTAFFEILKNDLLIQLPELKNNTIFNNLFANKSAEELLKIFKDKKSELNNLKSGLSDDKKEIWNDFERKTKEYLSNIQGNAKHQFDLKTLKLNFKFLRKNWPNNTATPDKNKLFKILFTNNEIRDIDLLRELRSIFLDKKKLKELRKDIAELKRILKSGFEKESINDPNKSNTQKTREIMNLDYDLVLEQKLKIIELAFNDLESQFLIVKPWKKTKEHGKKILLSVLSTIAFHILNQIQGSINKYGITDFRNILQIGAICVIVLIVVFALHLESGSALVGSKSIFRSQEKSGTWYKEIWKGEDNGKVALREEILIRVNGKKDQKSSGDSEDNRSNTNNEEYNRDRSDNSGSGSNTKQDDCNKKSSGCCGSDGTDSTINNCNNNQIYINNTKSSTVRISEINRDLQKNNLSNQEYKNKYTCCGGGCRGRNKFITYLKENSINNIENKDKICVCESCCMPTILRKIAEDESLNINVRREAYILYNEAIISNREIANSDVGKLSGGSCPCKNLSKPSEDRDSFILNSEVKMLVFENEISNNQVRL